MIKSNDAIAPFVPGVRAASARDVGTAVGEDGPLACGSALREPVKHSTTTNAGSPAHGSRFSGMIEVQPLDLT
jgi:hypothetical protein